MHSAIGVSTKISMNSPSSSISRTSRRSALNGEMKEHRRSIPASVISLATSPTRRMFSTRSTSVKPRSLVQPMPDIVAIEQNRARAMGIEPLSTRLAMVDLPEPESPVNHSTAGR